MFFDLDGTLLDTAPDFIEAINKVRVELALKPLPNTDLPDIRNAISFGLKAVTAVGFEEYLNQTETQLAILCDQVLKTYQSHLGLYSKPFPGILDLLENLEHRQIPWGIVTNKKIELTLPLLDRLHLKNRAACIVGGNSTSNPKPHPDPLYYACKLIDRPPNQCVFVGDAKTDIEAGKAAGMTTIAALFGYVGDLELAKQWGAHHNVEQVEDILPWALQWL